MKKVSLKILLFFIALLIGLAFLASIIFYVRQTVNFSFIDEYDNIVAAYFMTKGKVLFKDIFHHRQPGMVWISYILQEFLKPNTLYKLITYHRYFVIGFSLLSALLIIFRFHLVGLLFVLFYEVLKFFSHGNLFQGESLAIYPLVYLFGLFIYKYTDKKTYKYEDIFVGVCTWAIIFLRETLIPVTLFLYILILLKKSANRLMTFAVFSILSLLIILFLPLKDYWYQLVTINSGYVVKQEIAQYGGYFISLLRSFFYPIYVLTSFRSDEYNYYLMAMSLAFIILWFYLLKTNKKLTNFLFIVFFILGFSILRPVVPKPFFAAYKIGPWSALICFFLIYFLIEYLPKKAARLKSLFIYSVIFFFCFVSLRRTLIDTKGFDKIKVFDINYNRYYVDGEIVRILAEKNDNFYVDGYDSLVYWQAGIPSAYRYIIFYPPFVDEPYFGQERKKMFLNSPPVFYYKDCFDKKTFTLPQTVANKYSEFGFNKEGTCLYILKSKLAKTPKEKIEQIKKFGYYIID